VLAVIVIISSKLHMILKRWQSAIGRRKPRRKRRLAPRTRAPQTTTIAVER